ncbi:MAG: hypothetical protein U5L95_03300 [Candidatus Saccharibacteria bacterium]|nr:hypothetical protein [Candidatus Saccharibacteria bacterium]
MAFKGEIGHLEGFESPFANAGGVVKTMHDVEIMANTGVAYIEDGSQPLLPRLGNAVSERRKSNHEAKIMILIQKLAKCIIHLVCHVQVMKKKRKFSLTN